MTNQLTITADALLSRARAALTSTSPLPAGATPLVGVDLGTASIVMIALDGEGNPLACELQEAGVVRDGLVVDFCGALEIVRDLKARIEKRLGAELTDAAIAVPPGTDPANACAHRHLVESAGMEVVRIVDEPTAANEVLQVRDGVVVDIGGGTTGLTIFRDAQPVYTADEATGGVHISLVLMGAGRLAFEEAEARKRDPARAEEVLLQVGPVIEKMATIVAKHIDGYAVEDVWLAGGACCLPGVARIFKKVLGLPVRLPADPMLVTPLGIALAAKQID